MYKAIIKKNKAYLLLGTLFSILSSAAYVFAGYSLSFLFNAYGESFVLRDMIMNGVMVLFIWAITLTVMYFYNILQQKVICRMKTDLRKNMASKIVSMEIGDYLSKDTGNYVSWMTNDVELISGDVFENFFAIVDAVGQTLFSLFALFYFGIGVGITAILIFVFMAVVPQAAAKGLDEKKEAMSKAAEQATEKYKENLGGFVLYFLSNRQNFFTDTIKRISDMQEKAVYSEEKKSIFVNIVGGATGLIGQMILLLVTICMASLKVTPIGAVLSVGNLGGTFSNNVAASVESIIRLRSSHKLWDKYQIPENKHEYVDIESNTQTISLSHVNFSYDEKPVINDFSYSFSKGKKYALSGESGSGKTTLGKVLSGLLSGYEGSIRYDDQELKNISKRSLFRYVTYVDQNVFIFGESIRFNVTLGENYSDEEIWAALKRSNLADYIKGLNGQLDHVLTEDGKTLSGGQRQRLALARAFIRNISFIVLDEGTSALDVKNALEIENSLLNDKDLGLILISHQLKPQTLDLLDDIITIETSKHDVPGECAVADE